MRDTPRSITATALLAAIAPGLAPALAIVLGLAACDAKPTCEKAVDRVLELIKAEQNDKLLAKFPESERKKLAAMMEQSLPRDRLIADCKARYTKQQIACTIAAKTLADASSCNQASEPTGDEPEPGAAPGQPAPGAAPGEPAQGATPGAAPGEPAQGSTPAAEEGAGATGGAPGASGQVPAAGGPAQPAQPAGSTQPPPPQ